MGEPELVAGTPGTRPLVRWGLPDALLAWFAGFVASVVASAPFVDPDRPVDRQVGVLLVMLLAQAVGVVGALAVIARLKGRGSLRADFGLVVRLRDVGWVVVGVAVSMVARLALLPIVDLADLPDDAQDVVRVFQRASGVEVPLFALAVVAVAPVAEELLFRGALLRALVRRMPPVWAVLVSSFVFALVHVVGDPETAYYVPALLALGVISGWRALQTASLSQSIALHAGFNLLAAVLIVS